MAIDFATLKFPFDPSKGGPQFLEQTVAFATTVQKADVAIHSFDFGFTDSEHPVHRLAILPNVLARDGNTVRVGVELAIRDRSEFFDDTFDGVVDVLVIVVTA
jgi:hypothetical protein